MVTTSKIPHGFSPDAWGSLTTEQRRSFWEGWVAALNFALNHVSPTGLSTLSAEIASSEEALNAIRGK